MLRKLTRTGLLAAASTALCLGAPVAGADPAWRLNDRFGESHASTEQRTADDLDFTINIPSDWLTGGKSPVEAERERRIRRFATEAAGRKALTPAPRDGLELRFSGGGQPRDARRAADGTLRFDRIGATELERPFSFTINKRF